MSGEGLLMPRLFRVILPVDDIERASRFYGELLKTPGRRVSAGRHYFDCEGTILACYDPEADGDFRKTRPLSEPIYIAVEDLESAFLRAESLGAAFSKEAPAGVGTLGRIEQRPWGERSFYATDPFGNPFCFVAKDSVFSG